MSKPTIDELEEFFNSVTIPAVIQLSGSEFIRDVPKTVKSHIEVLRANRGNRTFMPFYDRLYDVYTKIK